jgi:hypothetical protein
MSTPSSNGRCRGAGPSKSAQVSGSLAANRRNHGAHTATELPSTQIRKPPTRTAAAGRGTIAMANIVLNLEKGIEIGAEDALKWLTGANTALHTAPEVVAALATLIAAIERPLADISGVAANPLNIALDIQTVNDLKAAWPAVRQFLTTMGVKF